MKVVVTKQPSKKEFILNMEQKKNSSHFLGDMEGLLNPNLKYNQEKAFEWLFNELVPRF